MAEDLPWMIERDDQDPAGSYLLSFSDEVAHGRDDLVERAERFLPTIPGIDEAFREDRELIVVRAPGLAAPDLRARFGEWWTRVSEEPPPWAELHAAIGAEVHAVVRPHGFRKRKQVFNREPEPGLVQVIDLFRVDESVRIEAGIYVESIAPMISFGDMPSPRPSWVGEPDCHIRGIIAIAGATRSHEVPLRGGAKDAAAFTEHTVLPVLDDLRSVDDLIRASDRGGRRIGSIGNEPMVLAAILAERGDLDGSHRVLQARFDAALPRQRPWILDRADRFGVEPLTTGTDPAMSVADDTVLAAWIAGVPTRVEQLRRLVTEHPDPAGRRRRAFRRRAGQPYLDGSLRSLSELSPWLLAVVVGSGTLPLPGETVPRRYRRSRLPGDPGIEPPLERLVELVAAYAGSVIMANAPGARWDLDENGHLGLATARSVPLLALIETDLIRISRDPQTDRAALIRRDLLAHHAMDAIDRLTG